MSYSHKLPPAFAARMQASLQEAYPAFLESLSRPAPTSIRINPSKYNDNIHLHAVPWSATGKYLTERPVFTLDPNWQAGAYYVQEASSMFLEQAFKQTVPVEKAINVLDLCAAPGGKSTHLLSLLNHESLLVANEVIRSRANILLENIEKWGDYRTVVTHNNPEDFNRLPGFFDVMVIDAPCSGEGLFRKDPNAMLEWSAEHVAFCAKRQQQVLSDAWPTLKEDGILIYATCTYNTAENEDTLRWIQQTFDVEGKKILINSAWDIETVQADQVEGYRFYPHRVKGEGFFIAVMQKKTAQPTIRSKSKDSFTSPTSSVANRLRNWLIKPEEKTIIQRNDQLQFFPSNKREEIALLAKHLYLLTAGTTMASLKHDKLIPAHPMALSQELNRENFATLALDKQDAIRYLKRETMHTSSHQKGFSLVTCNNLPLGWVNVLDNRINNLFPAAWRIRMASSDKG